MIIFTRNLIFEVKQILNKWRVLEMYAISSLYLIGYPAPPGIFLKTSRIPLSSRQTTLFLEFRNVHVLETSWKSFPHFIPLYSWNLETTTSSKPHESLTPSCHNTLFLESRNDHFLKTSQLSSPHLISLYSWNLETVTSLKPHELPFFHFTPLYSSNIETVTSLKPHELPFFHFTPLYSWNIETVTSLKPHEFSFSHFTPLYS